jgi:hypothetical protein
MVRRLVVLFGSTNVSFPLTRPGSDQLARRRYLRRSMSSESGWLTYVALPDPYCLVSVEASVL